jgi:diaminohydroxyphosphoribosylaminopyrimidine deaminase/5-amino-6-(5-phosphoribosylamino)uracil reductase
VLIEGGGELLASAFAERIVTRIVWFVSPSLIGGRAAPGSFGGRGIRRLDDRIHLADVVYTPSGPDLRIDATVVYPARRRAGVGP